MNIDEFFEVFTGGNSNVATWTPKAIKEFAEDYHNQQLRLHGVSKRLRDLVDRMQIVSDLKYPDRKYTPEFKDTMLTIWKGKETELEQRVVLLEKEINVC